VDLLEGTLPLLQEACQKIKDQDDSKQSSYSSNHTAVAVVPTDEAAVDGDVEGAESPQDEFTKSGSGILDGDAEDNAAAMIARTPGAMLGSKLEAVLLYLQVSSTIWSFPGVLWPHVVFPWMSFLADLLAVFNLKLNLSFVQAPKEVSSIGQAVFVVFLLPLLLWYASTRLWRDMVLWRHTYIEQWDNTFYRGLIGTLGINVIVATVCMSLSASLIDISKTVYFICLGASLGTFLMWLVMSKEQSRRKTSLRSLEAGFSMAMLRTMRLL
jgi:hypothetical protein